ncbi:MAG: TetR/AcrR family transcriptional regulator [Candidatus Binatia bacterium]
MKHQAREARLSPEERRKKIVDAALRVFSSKGFRGATTKEIARAAGINEVTLFRYFGNKENLFSEVFEHHSLFPTLRELIPRSRDESYEKVMTGLAARIMEILSKRKDLIRLVLFESYQYPDQGVMFFQQIYSKIFQPLGEYLEEKKRSGKIGEIDPELAARAFLGMFFSFFVAQEFLLGKKVVQVSDEAVMREFVRIFLHGTQRNA